ncbi:hypothetical protein CROQUDRAFT_106674 [Cronartium quercuum f. sp. fusiforme G11]|uniref:Uncharacterized protein n=1 Tax=Cronartium quercuum f. sp. fusiforme G11 TaxID=708437 RepID=A0A9P6TC73_9BASI|nr:hypothetical protein CROQUDRAFT_106674 [Cronartium quercuum f. sp. fusiforme G11]
MRSEQQTPRLIHIHYEHIVFALISLVNCIVSFASTVALSRQSWSSLKSLGLLWALVVGLSLVRAIAMLVILNLNSFRVAQLCGTADTTSTATNETAPPSIAARVISSPFQGMAALYCPLGFHTLFVAFAASMIIDGVLQAYAASLVVRTYKRMAHYKFIQSSTIDDLS